MFATRVDADDLLRKTDLAVDFGLRPFAIQRGNHVEQIGRANGYAVTIDLLRTDFGFGIDEVVPLDLRRGFPKNERGMIARARRTRQAIEANILFADYAHDTAATGVWSPAAAGELPDDRQLGPVADRRRRARRRP